MLATVEPQPIALIRKDLRAAAVDLTIPEVRYLVDLYYSWQDFRIQAGNQSSALGRSGEPHAAIAYTASALEETEDTIRAMLDSYTRREPTGMGAWAREVVGIGPVIAAGLLAHVDVTHCPTVGHLWSFAGLNPEQRWEKGQKRPWNARLKVLAFKIGESFVKVQNNPRDIYGKVYAERKVQEQTRNEALTFADQARAKLERFKIGKDTEAYKWYQQGKLPPAHIHARARRYCTKLFLSHYWEEAYVRHYGHAPPLPYPIQFLGHAHKIERPNPGG